MSGTKAAASITYSNGLATVSTTKISYSGALKVFAFGGTDTINASSFNPGAGTSAFDVGAGDNTLVGSQGNDVIVGSTTGNDRLDGYFGNDTIWGFGGNDTILGNTGNDVLDAGTGTNVVLGGLDNDSILGGTGNDDCVATKVTTLSSAVMVTMSLRVDWVSTQWQVGTASILWSQTPQAMSRSTMC